MYSTCIFCASRLEANNVLPDFPVGRRLAFDAERGRLWVVCRRCERWNLTPLEERWEAIEACERLFRDARLRVSTDNIGLARIPAGLDLARIPAGLDLVRIGRPQRPELAAWRYGDQFGRRRKQRLVQIAGGAAFGVGLALGAWAIAGQIVAINLLGQLTVRGVLNRFSTPRSWVRLGGEERKVTPGDTRLLPGGEPGTLRLCVPYEVEPDGFPIERTIDVEGETARWYLSGALAQLNRRGAERPRIARAVDLLSSQADAAGFLAFARTLSRGRAHERYRIGSMPATALLALEMALHEETERRAMEGDLAVLESAWREAEGIAAIADRLALPASVDEALAAAKEPPGGARRGEG